uniref:SID1 transmembrane family member 1 n=1 Tax=Varanus komodoensis TaxID=61221 RepID=A0A8D2ISC2_VARKO
MEGFVLFKHGTAHPIELHPSDNSIFKCMKLPFAIFGLVYRPKDFASYMLGIFICNLLLYLAFYVIMKLRNAERLLPIPLFCIVATAVVWAAALYFFFQNLSSWEETPAESREKNRPCILLEFFDDHDVWHFLSAAALFFSFLVRLSFIFY